MWVANTVQDGGLEAAVSRRIDIMIKNCKKCQAELNESNWLMLKTGTIRGVCRKCRSKHVMDYHKDRGEVRRTYIRNYIRRIGRVKEYPCETCQTMCIKKYKRAFCSDKCRFMAHIQKTGSCWLWTSAQDRRGYGRLCFAGSKHAVASRVSYELFNGPIEKGKLVCHTCDVPACVNPEHLWLGSVKDNAIDMIQKNRSLKGEKHNLVKVTEGDIIAIRKMHLLGIAQNKIAELFGLTAGHLNNIIKRRVWKHIV